MLERVIRTVRETPWAILPSMLTTICDLLALHAEGERLSDAEIRARLDAAAAANGPRPLSQGGRQQGAVAVLPLYGVISQRVGLLTELSGGTSTQQFAALFHQALADPSIGAIVVDVDSPGGSAFGVPELADVLFRARGGGKPIVTVANSLAASAAYWIATAADEFVVTTSAEVGSIGVRVVHEEFSERLAREGVRRTTISAGVRKNVGSPDVPLTDDDRAAIQKRVNDYYALFVEDVARFRGVSPAEVRGGFGEGWVVGATEAVRLGMADRIETLEEVIERMMRRRPARAGAGPRTEGPGAGIPVAGPLPPHRSPRIAAEDAEWDADAEVAKASGREELRRMHVWMDDEGDPDAKSSYKGPHHRADGTLVPRGVFAMAGRMEQMDVPQEDMPGMRRHMDAHYREMGKEPPMHETTPHGSDETAEGFAPLELSAADRAELDLRRRRLRLAAGAELQGGRASSPGSSTGEEARSS